MPGIADISAHYDRLTDVYETRWADYLECQAEWVFNHWPRNLPENFTALDLGCGTGWMLERIRRQWPRATLTGVDASANMLKHAQRRAPDANLLCCNLEDAAFSAALMPADVVLSMSVLHHINDIERHLRLLRQLVNPGGTIFLSAFAKEGLVMQLADIIFRWTQNFHHKSLSYGHLSACVETAFPRSAVAADILYPGKFWRVQIFAISIRE